MTSKLQGGRLVLSAFGILVFGVALGGGAQAVTDTIFKYTSPKTGYLSLGPGAFSLDGYNNDNTKLTSIGGIFGSDPMNMMGSCGLAGVNLPQGAKVTAINFWATSTSGTGPSLSFYRVAVATGAQQTIGDKTLKSMNGNRLQVNMALEPTQTTIDNQTYFYHLLACANGASSVKGARITYTYDNAGD